jgi:peptidoglycan/xylan/chitin deacetylase (PgdA/CDA1 family)
MSRRTTAVEGDIVRREQTVVLTFDNLGEASALQRGTWNPRTPLGSDPSVTRALPWLLDALDDSGLHATFFVEAINCELNPEAVQMISARGHELGVHGWEHEVWAELGRVGPDSERDLLERAVRAFAALGLTAPGFRPPGGELTARTPALLRELGFQWCSPAGGGSPCLDEGLVVIPFDWELVDAYHLMERFADLRERRGDPPAPLHAQAAGDRMAAALREAGTERTVVMHPFLMLDEPWRGQVMRLLELLAAGDARVLSGGELASSRVGS